MSTSYSPDVCVLVIGTYTSGGMFSGSKVAQSTDTYADASWALDERGSLIIRCTDHGEVIACYTPGAWHHVWRTSYRSTVEVGA